MKKIHLLKYFFILTIITSFNRAQAQTFDYNWSNPSGSSLDEYANAMVKDANGNVYTTGRFQGTIDFDPSVAVANKTSNGSEDVFITKFDASGNLIWVKTVGSIASDFGMAICIDSNNDLIITGSFLNTVDFDPGAGTFNITPVVNSDGFILKLTSDGNFVWAKSIGGGNSQSILSVTTDSNDNILLTGYANGNTSLDPNSGSVVMVPVGSNDIFVVKLSSAGNYIWSKTLGSTNSDISYGINTNSLNEVFIVGSFQLNPDFDPGAGVSILNSNGIEDAFIWKLDASGNFVYAKSFGGTGTDAARSITFDDNDMPYVSGYFSGTADLDPSSSVMSNYTSAGLTDGFVIKLTSNGDATWISAFGQTGNDIALSCDYNAITSEIFTTGRFYNTVDFNNGASVFNLTSAGDADIFIQRLDLNGNFITAYQMGGTGADIGFSISASSDVILVGQFNATADFDPSSSVANETSIGSGDIFVASYNVCPLPSNPISITGSTIVCSGTTETYSIPVSSGAIDYTWSAPSGWIGNSTSNTINFDVNDVSGIISVVANNACGSSAAAILNIDAYLTPSVFVTNTSVCENNSAQLEAGTDIGSISWFDSPSGGTLLGTGLIYTTPLLTSNATYYVESDNNGCKNNPRESVTVTVNPMPNDAISYSSGSLISSQSGAFYQWLDCDNSFLPIVGETNANYVLTTSGSFAVEINLNGCVDTSDCEQIFLSANEFTPHLVEIYPNPNDGQFTVIITHEEAEIVVYNMTGELVYSQRLYSNQNVINLPNLSGVFIAEIIFPNAERIKTTLIIN